MIRGDSVEREVAAYGAKCQVDNCPSAAVATVYWPGQTTRQCAIHANKAQNIAAVMGFAVTVEPIPVAYEAPTVTPLGRPEEMRTSELLRTAASLLEAFAWGQGIAQELRVRAQLLEGAAQ